mmetsp:Transcript_2743/g.4719  ORF Transcript_2743/g.4719 Transcript_2743/m.4719 type:complete len:132 (-) Transcript_2743:269-664(-)
MWDKWTMLATLAGATCLMKATLGEIVSTKYGSNFVQTLFRECCAVAHAEGITVSNEAMFQRLTSDRQSIIKASMCRDMEGGGPTEADHVLGDLILRAAHHNIATPTLSIAYARLEIYEAQRQQVAGAAVGT